MITRSGRLDALLIWFGLHAGIMVTTLLGVALADYLGRWRQWDVVLFATIAEHGYDGDPAKPHDPGLPAFFPGLPLLMRLVHLVVPDWTAAGLLISLVAGAVAVVALARLAEAEGASGWMAVVALLLFPTAVFLTAGYSESLFLAFAIPAWLAARHGRWPQAAMLAAGASCVRITGLFLAAALVVEFCVRKEPLRKTGWLVLPLVPLGAYSAYQYSRLSDWLAWMHAQEAGWGRRFTWPWEAWATSWREAMGHGDFSVGFRMEIVGAVVSVCVTVLLLVLRRWSEAVYAGAQATALLVSSYYLSVPRSLLLCFPLWLLVARVATRRPWVMALYALILGPLMLFHASLFLNGRWAG
ncbi:mannosyltransferase family protein [Nonomuraea fuscirosea]|uniref:mannosyltransferase family protein n=1 Tax=Nonomuraea fuscirosea TaxID=1291556 RepID=UPI002DD8581B|nr:mannosyltransferase family protein [Nonomuraea fuscirosea]WSA56109.1 mannosyltransferase family protein [Nonomuraea fuscirosea]